MLKWTVTKRAETVAGSSARRSLGNVTHDATAAAASVRKDEANRRRSVGVVVGPARKAILREANKENRQPATPYPRRDSMPLRDVSNMTPTLQTTTTTTTVHPRKRSLQAVIARTEDTVRTSVAEPVQYASTLPSFDVEYSPCGLRSGPFLAMRGLGVADSYYEQPRYFADEPAPPTKRSRPDTCPPPSVAAAAYPFTPLATRLNELRFSKMSYRHKSPTALPHDDESMRSSAMGDLTLDRMIDAILESAKKDPGGRVVAVRRAPATRKATKRSVSMKGRMWRAPTVCESPTYTAAEDPASDLTEFDVAPTASPIINLSPDRLLAAGERTIIIEQSAALNEREICTPDSVKGQLLKRQKAVRRKHHRLYEMGTQLIGLTLPNGIPSPETPPEAIIASNALLTKRHLEELAQMETPTIGGRELPPASSTPTFASTAAHMTRRCLSFSSPPDADEHDLTATSEFDPKRQSVASSTTSRSSRGSQTAMSHQTGTIDLAVYVDDRTHEINVHVIRCRDLQRSNGSSAINAYVKVAILPSATDVSGISDMNGASGGGYQRTAVHRNSTRPYFDHRFTFDLNGDGFDAAGRVQLAVWHRNREIKRSEFLGCLSLPLKNVLKKEINGSFRLQPQSCLTNPMVPVVATATQVTTTAVTGATATTCAVTTMGEHSLSSVEDVAFACDDLGGGGSSIGCGTGTGTGTGTVTLSKRAIHQRDADENLFLRFLELDPSPTEAVAPGAAGVGAAGAAGVPPTSVASTLKRTPPVPASVPVPVPPRPGGGRTPFTMTKRLTRTSERGFGFSIVWTHPPRVEKIEPHLPAERAGIQPGDYIIFVDKQNVVTMPEMDILNLIRAQGAALTLEIFRRPMRKATATATASGIACGGGGGGIGGNGTRSLRGAGSSEYTAGDSVFCADDGKSMQLMPVTAMPAMQAMSTIIAPSTTVTATALTARSSIACSNASISMEATKRRLHLPQVTFSKEKLNFQSIVPHTADDQRRRFLYQLIQREQNFIQSLQFGMQRFVDPLRDRKTLISPGDHRTLFQNIDELLRISEDILEQLVQEDADLQIQFAARVYLSKTTAICAAYKKYCNGLKRADCVLVNKSRLPNSEFVQFITEPQVPRKRPDLTTFIHRPLQHFREILKLVQMIASHCRLDTDEYKNFTNVIAELQGAYREITVGGGLMEPLGEGRPLLTLQDLEARMVFTKCKPFVLAAPGRQWIFGGDLARVEGRSVKPYWTLLFSDILLFAKVSRDRVLFITEEPLSLSNVTDSCFNIRKKLTEFRITIDPNGRLAESPTVHCTPDLTKTPKKTNRKRNIVLRAPSAELKAVWQNLLQRQIFLVNAALGGSAMSSPLESPSDLLIQTLIPLSDIGATTTSMASMKLSVDGSLATTTVTTASLMRNNGMTGHGGTLAHQLQQHQQQQSHNHNHINNYNHNSHYQHHINNHQLAMGGAAGHTPPSTAMSVSGRSSTVSRHLEELIDEKCRLLNKQGGTSKGGALHLAQWMKGQLDQNENETAATISDGGDDYETPIATIDDDNAASASASASVSASATSEMPLVEWSAEQLAMRSRELRLIDEKGRCCAIARSGTPSGRSIETVIQLSEIEESTSRSTESGSQITVRSSPNAKNSNDPSIPMCRNCHRNCRSRRTSSASRSPPPPLTLPPLTLPQSLSGTVASAEDAAVSCGRATSAHDCKCGDERWRQRNGKIPENDGQDHPSSAITGSTVDLIQDTSPPDWSLMLIGLAQISPTATLMQLDPFEAVPTISVVPPTPEGTLSGGKMSHSPNIWDFKQQIAETSIGLGDHHPLNGNAHVDSDNSPEDSPVDEEPPYRTLASHSPALRRYGTMSSLERLPSEEQDDKTLNSSDDEQDATLLAQDPELPADDDISDIKIITREVYGAAGAPTIRNWTARAGSFVAEKMSFLEESRAFLDRYLGRWEPPPDAQDECTSGATSGEEVWGTPTSGGENEESQCLNSDNADMSPTKSSSSLTGDDDTELMMDELLMAPPMTASSMRGLLPRRRLEPLFEEDSESCETDEDDDDDDNNEAENDEDDDDEDETGDDDLNGGGRLNQGHDRFADGDIDRNGRDEGSTTTSTTTPTATSDEAVHEDKSLEQKLVSSSSESDVPTLTSPVKMMVTAVPSTSTTIRPTDSGNSADICLKRAHPANTVPNCADAIEGGVERRAATVVTVTPRVPPPVPERRCRPPPTQSPATTAAAAASATTAAASTSGSVSTSTTTTPSACMASTSPTVRQLADTVACAPGAATTGSGDDGGTEPPNGTQTDTAWPMGRISPRLEMRLALNHDIIGDEDLIGYDPYSSILGRDLSRCNRRLTGRDLLQTPIRSPHWMGVTAPHAQAAPAAVASENGFSQQRNSKMDTPTPNRKKSSHNTWNSFAFAEVDRTADVVDGGAGGVDGVGVGGAATMHELRTTAIMNLYDDVDETKLSDLERLARREKMNYLNQLKSSNNQSPKSVQSASPAHRQLHDRKTNRFFNFWYNRTSESHLLRFFSRENLNDAVGHISPKQISPRIETDKSLDRRFWKQLSKRRRSSVASEITTTNY